MSPQAALILNDSVRREACDYCRKRKLGCTKDATGCLRCVGEGLICSYSARKIVGRPKKRNAYSESASDRTGEAQREQEQPAIHIMRLTSMAVEPTSNPAEESASTVLDAGEYQHPTAANFLDFLHGGLDVMGQIDFDPPAGFASGPMTAGLSTRNEDSSRSVSSAQCNCLKMLFASIDSLSQIPSHWQEAIRAARHASRTAFQVLACTHGEVTPQLEPSRSIVLILSVAVPSIANAYRIAISLIDAEAAAAKAEGRKLPFDLTIWGGLWGTLGQNNIRCQEYYDGIAMDADMWQRTVRALLRADIYGVDVPKRDGRGECYVYHHEGLWDAVRAMRSAGAPPDADSAAWAPPVIGTVTPPASQNGSARTDGAISQVVDMAEQALEGLVIA